MDQTKRRSARKKLPVTVIFADPLVKEVKTWKLSDKNNEEVIMKLRTQLTVRYNLEDIALHCGKTYDKRLNARH